MSCGQTLFTVGRYHFSISTLHERAWSGLQQWLILASSIVVKGVNWILIISYLEIVIITLNSLYIDQPETKTYLIWYLVNIQPCQSVSDVLFSLNIEGIVNYNPRHLYLESWSTWCFQLYEKLSWHTYICRHAQKFSWTKLASLQRSYPWSTRKVHLQASD